MTPHPGIEAALLAPDDLAPLADAWDDLAARAIEPNVFASRWLASARLRHLPDRGGARVLVAWTGGGDARRLLGLLVLVRARGAHLNPLPILRAAELYAPLSAPLLDPDRPAAIWAAMLGAAAGAGIAALALPFLDEDGPAALALREAAAERRLPMATLGRHRRAFLRSDLAGEAYLARTLEKRRRKEAERQRRRLEEAGSLRVSDVSAADRPEALERFFALEAAGWKGRAGTDLAAAEGGAAYWRDAAAASAGSLRIVMLEQGEHLIAAGLVAVARDRAFYVKTAYDEAHARSSPGLLLTLDLTVLLLDDPAIRDADSVAVEDHPMIDRIWTDRLAIGSAVVATRPGGGLLFRLALAAERTRLAAREKAKLALARVRAWRGGRG